MSEGILGIRQFWIDSTAFSGHLPFNMVQNSSLNYSQRSCATTSSGSAAHQTHNQPIKQLHRQKITTTTASNFNETGSTSFKRQLLSTLYGRGGEKKTVLQDTLWLLSRRRSLNGIYWINNFMRCGGLADIECAVYWPCLLQDLSGQEHASLSSCLAASFDPSNRKQSHILPLPYQNPGSSFNATASSSAPKEMT